MSMRIFIIVICFCVSIYMILLVPHLHLGDQMTSQLIIQNLSFYNMNARLPTKIELPAGTYTLSGKNMMWNGFSSSKGIPEIPKDIEIKVEIPDNTNSQELQLARMFIMQGSDKVLYKGKMAKTRRHHPILLQEGDSVRIKVGEENSYIILCFNYQYRGD